MKCEGFLCNNKRCLESNEWVCDGINDCMDNSDEEHCSSTCDTEDLKFLCKDNITCLPIEAACNGNSECPDNSDEKGMCESKKACNEIKCERKCHLLPTGPVCECQNGFKFNKKTKICEVRYIFINIKFFFTIILF